MFYTCKMKSSGITKDGKIVDVVCMVGQIHKRSVVALHHLKNFKGI